MDLSSHEVPASVVAIASSLHVAFALLRQHRGHPGPLRAILVALSSAFAAAPWAWPDAAIIGAGLGLHVLFFVLTDRLTAESGAGAGTCAAPRPRGAAAGRTAAPARGVIRGDQVVQDIGPAKPVGGRVDALPRPSGPSSTRLHPGSEPVAPAAANTRRTERSQGFVPLHVLDVLQETPDIRTFRLARPSGFDFAAGQFIAVRVRVDSQERVRCYSISSAPSVIGYLEISVKKQGLVSAALHATLRPGATLHARPPAGAFVYPADDDRPLVLIAGGVGITPLVSMARHAVAADPSRPVTLIQSARAVDGLAFASELRLLQRRHPRLRWVPAVTSGSVNGEYYPGRIDGALLRMVAPDVTGAIVCMCGPDALIHDLRAELLAAGVPNAQVRFERFEAAVAAVGAERAESVAATSAAPAADAPAAGTITFVHSQATHAAALGETVLDGAEACGVEIPTLCRAGVCGTCRTRLLEGDVDCASVALDDEDRADGWVLACVARVRGDCAVEA